MMDRKTLRFVFCLCITAFSIDYHKANTVISTSVTFHGYRKWTPVNSTRNDMYCPEDCYDNPEEDERCCCCNAVPCWELDAATCNVTIGQLNIEYKDIYGSALFIPSGNYTLYEAIHSNGRLTTFPKNLCEFADNLVKLDLSYNRLENISDIRCLNKLDTLRLDGNKITEISNDTFSDMEYLRIVSLSRNNIEILHPNTNQRKNGNILVMDISYNIIETIDVTNMIRAGPFCSMSCVGCEITEQTNIRKYEIDEHNIHGPGNVILKNTSGNAFLNFTKLGVNDYTKFGHYFKGRLEYDGSSISCDCNLYPFFTGLGMDAAKFWPRLDFGDVICNNPENMKGRNLSNLYLTQMFEELTCNILDCPYNCICTDKPSENYVRVVCIGLTSMPDFVPVGSWNNDKIDLDLSDPSNDISEFPYREYMNRLVKVDLSGNNIQTFDTESAERFSGSLQISMNDQNLKNLPQVFNRLNPRRITFGANPVRCDCGNRWIGDWIRYNEAQGRLQCSTSKGVVPAEAVNSDFLECPHKEEPVPVFLPILLTVLVVSIFLIILSAYCFRFEIMLLKRKYITHREKLDNYEFDAMLTFSEENPEIFGWLEHSIIPALKIEGYSLFVPFYQIRFGGNREYELAEGVNKSKNYVVFLCNKYLCDEKSVQEFETLWKHFCMTKTKHIIVINFDSLTFTEIKDPRLRAFRIIQDDLNFTEREVRIFERLKHRLGSPIKISNSNDYEDDKSSQDTEDYEVHDTQSEDDDTNEPNAEKTNTDHMRNILWYNRLAVRSTTCNCTYRKCYLHAKDAFNVNAENDWLRKREKAREKKNTKCNTHTSPFVLYGAKNTMPVADSNESVLDFEC